MGALAPVADPDRAGERRSLLVAFPILGQSVADRRSATSEWAADIGEELRAKAQDEAARQASDEADKVPAAGRANSPAATP